jgi:predicted flavoprotein YhiN
MPRGKNSTSSHLKKTVGLQGVKAGLLWELLPKESFQESDRLAAAIKNLPITLVAARPLEEAISSAGGISFDSLDENLMLKDLPGVFCAGEMLDWEAPTGGYLLTACFSTGRVAGLSALEWLAGMH